jgi:hypothetical protein
MTFCVLYRINAPLFYKTYRMLRLLAIEEENLFEFLFINHLYETNKHSEHRII